METDTEPVLNKQKDQAIKGVQRHSGKEGLGVSSTGKHSKKDEKSDGNEVQHQSNDLSSCFAVAHQSINCLGHSQSDDESESAP